MGRERERVCLCAQYKSLTVLLALQNKFYGNSYITITTIIITTTTKKENLKKHDFP